MQSSEGEAAAVPEEPSQVWAPLEAGQGEKEPGYVSRQPRAESRKGTIPELSESPAGI